MDATPSTLYYKFLAFIPLLLAMLSISGCASFGEGVANAVINKSEQEDVRVCEVWGKPFPGIEQGLKNRQAETHVLMTHGVGDHEPGYATEFMEKLASELDLNVRSRYSKNITLTAPEGTGKNLGNLRITHLLNKSGSNDLLFYELTWSEITAEQKALLAFDNSGEYTFRRTKINNMLKQFANDTGPDPIIYLGESRPDILEAFSQSFCWMVQGGWDKLPDSGKHLCSGLNAQQVIEDNYVFVSHSLGSRITIDGMQLIADKIHDAIKEREVNGNEELITGLKNKNIPIYMLSNQLPMLQLGRELPKVTRQRESYCTPGAPHYNDRMVKKTSIIAFSDPNDLLSYAIPPGFSDAYIDSRLCTEITNININIAHIIDVLSLGKIANPMEAHTGYDTDDRVVALIAKGIGTSHTAPIVKERCEWTDLVD